MSNPIPQPPNPGDEILGGPLWQLEFADGELCVAECGEQLFVVLFTSPERVREFIETQAADAPDPTLSLFSESLAQFRQAAGAAVDDAVHGAVIDPSADGQVSLIVDFLPRLEPDEAA
jgi:hypothetical protein